MRRPRLPGERRPGIPQATVARLPLYHRVLATLAGRGDHTVSSEELAEAAGVNSAQVRKDLSHLGSPGVRGVGYSVDQLAAHITRALGAAEDWPVVIVGLGNLGHALANYAGFGDRGFRVAALVDAAPKRAGESVAGLTIRPLAELEDVVLAEGIVIAVVAVPGPAAQSVVDRLVGAGVTSVLNFAPVALRVPAGVEVRHVDLASELQILAFHEHAKTGVPARPRAVVRA